MLTENKRALLRLQGRPEFAVRHDELVEFHGHEGALGLVIQARPLSASWLDLADAQIEKRVLAGAGTQAGWWDSFRSATRGKPTLNGIASLPSWDKPSWALEAHRDGHFIAGIWTFPDINRGDGSQTKAMPVFYSAAIKDFLTIGASVVTLPSSAENGTAASARARRAFTLQHCSACARRRSQLYCCTSCYGSELYCGVRNFIVKNQLAERAQCVTGIGNSGESTVKRFLHLTVLFVVLAVIITTSFDG